MAKRLIKAILPEAEKGSAYDCLEEFNLNAVWFEKLLEDKITISFLVSEDKSDPIIKKLQEKYEKLEVFNLLIFSLEASLPKDQAGQAKGGQEGKEQKQQKRSSRISKEELFEDASKSAQLSMSYMMLTVLSTVIAASGLIAENTITIIGAAMIAPLLGPNVAFSLALVLNDVSLMKDSLKAAAVGLGISVVLSITIGFFVLVNFPEEFITSGTVIVDLRSIVVALAAGTAGALAFSTGVSTVLVGVVVAVALLPPLVRMGLIIGEGQWASAWQAFLLVAINLICINLASVSTFFIQGVGHQRDGEREGKAKKVSLLGIGGWFILLVLFAILMFLSKG